MTIKIKKKNKKYNVFMNSWLKRRHERRKLPHYVLNMFVDQTKDYNIGICCFSAKHAVLRRKNKYWLIQNQDNVSERVGIVQSGPHHHLFEN